MRSKEVVFYSLGMVRIKSTGGIGDRESLEKARVMWEIEEEQEVGPISQHKSASESTKYSTSHAAAEQTVNPGKSRRRETYPVQVPDRPLGPNHFPRSHSSLPSVHFSVPAVAIHVRRLVVS